MQEKIDLNMSEFWYLGRPIALAEYRRQKRLQEEAEMLDKIVEDVQSQEKVKFRKKGRKRNRNGKGTLHNRLRRKLRR